MASKPSFVSTCALLMEACETGKGWEGCASYCAADATFSCDVLPMTSMQAYTDWMAGIISNVAPDGAYTVRSLTWNDSEVTYVAIFEGTHTGTGGPVPAADPPKKMKCDYSYTFRFDSEGKCVHMHKVWDFYTACKGWGWPL